MEETNEKEKCVYEKCKRAKKFRDFCMDHYIGLCEYARKENAKEDAVKKALKKFKGDLARLFPPPRENGETANPEPPVAKPSPPTVPSA